MFDSGTMSGVLIEIRPSKRHNFACRHCATEGNMRNRGSEVL